MSEVNSKNETTQNPATGERTKYVNQTNKEQGKTHKIRVKTIRRVMNGLSEVPKDMQQEFFNDAGFTSTRNIRGGGETNTGKSWRTSGGSKEREQRKPPRTVEMPAKQIFRQNNKSDNERGSKVLQRRNVKAKNNQVGPFGNVIRVIPIPPEKMEQDIFQFFKKFGFVTRCKLERNWAIVEFRNMEPINILLNNPPDMDGQKLKIHKATWKRREPPPQNPVQRQSEKLARQVALDELKLKLKSETTFEKELSIFLETIQMSEDEVEKKWGSIHTSLLEALKPSFPNCEINQFGSTLTGLCFKGSDIDVYLNIGEPINEDESQKIGWTPATIFKEVKSSLDKQTEIFQKIVPIQRAVVPIIKFLHSPTSTNCDISFKTGLGVMNSQMIKRLLSLDVRIKPLMIIIKFLVNTFELTGPGKFANYAMVMMIIFYLQQPETKLLPTIEELQKTGQPIYQWNWQVNFDRDSKFPASTNEDSVSDLLAGFFKFYEKFPFKTTIIRPLTGLAQSKEDFTKICVEQGKGPRYLGVEQPICLQDPIRLNENITSSVSKGTFRDFQTFCAIGARICQTHHEIKEKPLLIDLFTSLQVLLENSNSLHVTISSKQTLEAGLPADFNERNDIENTEEFIENNWYTLTEKLVEDVLKRVIKMNVRMARNDCEKDQEEIAELSDTNSTVNKKSVLECWGDYYDEKRSTFYDSIKGQRKKGSNEDSTLGKMDQEALIFEEIVKKQKEMGIRPIKLEFTCTIQRERNPVRLIIRFKDRKDNTKCFKRFESFWIAKLRSIVNQELGRIRGVRDEENRKTI